MTVPPLTSATAFTAWTVDPFAVVCVLLLGGVYTFGLRTLRRRGQPWPRSRTLAFGLLGLGSLVLVTMSGIGAYDDVLFSMRAVQVVVLLMVTPLGLALGAPVSLLLAALPERPADRLRSALAGRTARVLASPPVTSVLLVGTPFLLYLTPWYEAVLRHGALDELLRVLLVAVGFLYFWNRLQLDPVPRRYPQLLSVLISLVEVIGDGVLGLVLWLGSRLVAGDYYLALARDWGPSPRTDQIIGAGVLWILGDLAGLPFLLASFRRMSQDDAAEAAEIDRLLDEHMDELAAPADPGAPAGPVLMRPWWEDDPVLSERFRRGG